MVSHVPKTKIRAIIESHQRRYDGLRNLLKNQDNLTEEELTEINAQLHEIGHFIDQLEELL